MNANVSELADEPVLETGAYACRFKSCHPHHKRTNFCLPDECSFFSYFRHIFGQNKAKSRKIRKITRCSGRRDCRSVVFMPAAAQKSTLLFVVLCSNKEQQKHCVVRELNQNNCKVYKTRTILPPPLPLYKMRELCYTYSI